MAGARKKTARRATPKRTTKKSARRDGADTGGLTAKQQAFVQEYPIDFNAAAAARRAGYASRYADRQAWELLENPRVQAAIAKAIDARRERTEITQDRVLQELARIAFADVRDLFTWDEERTCFVPSANLTADQAAAISAVKAKTTRYTREDGTEEQRIELELKTYDKRGALDLLGKHLGLFVERHRVEGVGGGPLALVYVAELPDGRRVPLGQALADDGRRLAGIHLTERS